MNNDKYKSKVSFSGMRNSRLSWIHRSNMDSLFTEKKSCWPHLRGSTVLRFSYITFSFSFLPFMPIMNLFIYLNMVNIAIIIWQYG